MTEHLVLGYGEVGKAIQQVFQADWIDKKDNNAFQTSYTYLHVCIPFEEESSFFQVVLNTARGRNVKHIIIHSTVPVGTSRKLNATHSPIRGIHPNLYEGVKTFHKFLGGPNASQVADVFRKAGIKVILCDRSETTELGKLLDTEYYRVCIEFTKNAKEQADKFNVSFHEAYTLFNMTYNEGYQKLDHPEYVRPVLQPIMTPIGGHCLIPNKKLLENS